MRTATQIHAARFEQVVKAGVYADAGVAGAVRRQILDAAKAVVLYVNAGEVNLGMKVAQELVAQAKGEPRADPMQRCLDQMETSCGVKPRGRKSSPRN